MANDQTRLAFVREPYHALAVFARVDDGWINIGVSGPDFSSLHKYREELSDPGKLAAVVAAFTNKVYDEEYFNVGGDPVDMVCRCQYCNHLFHDASEVAIAIHSGCPTCGLKHRRCGGTLRCKSHPDGCDECPAGSHGRSELELATKQSLSMLTGDVATQPGNSTGDSL